MGRGADFSVIISPELSPRVAPPALGGGIGGIGLDRDDRWGTFDNSVNAVSFGFVATAILISMFLVMAIFEKFLRQRSSRNPEVVESSKLTYPSPKMSIYPNGVSVLMPGEKVPTFMAHPAPPPCPREHVSRSVLLGDTFPGLPSSSRQ